MNIDVIMDNQELPPSLSSDAPNAEGSQSASTLAREVDVAGEMALRALDVSFLLLEKVRMGLLRITSEALHTWLGEGEGGGRGGGVSC